MKQLLLVLSLMAGHPATAADCVVLLHGLARSSLSMEFMATRLRLDGFKVVNKDYPSTSATIQTLADQVLPAAVAECEPSDKVDFVTHSMGGLLVRQYLKETHPANLGRVVMMGPPNKGSPIVDEFKDMPGFEFWNGIAGTQLGTGADSVPNTLGPVDFPLGVIAGSQPLLPLFEGEFGGPNDGKVSVESTKVEGMADHIILPVTHTFMMNNPDVYDQVVAFLRNGRFKR
jgi:triacylglycerol lipase